MNKNLVQGLGLVTTLAIALMVPGSANAAKKNFYKGKKITHYVGYNPGGGYDTYSRLSARHLGKHIPGNPKIIVKNKPGAGSMRLANEMYNKSPRDGTVIGMFGNSLHLGELVGRPNIKFVSTKFNWLGRITDGDTVFVVRPGAGVNSFSDLQRREVIVGVPGAGSATTLMTIVINNVLGTKFKLISGYRGSTGVKLALERGEVEGSQSILWAVSKQWATRTKMKVLYQLPSVRLSHLKNIPSVIEYAKTDDQKKLIKFFSSYVTLGRSVVAPPGLPKDRVRILRAAFMKSMKDKALIAEVSKYKLRFNPMSGEKVQTLVASAFNLSADLKAKAKAAAKVGKLKKRKKVMVTVKGKILKRNKKGSKLTLALKSGKKVKIRVGRRKVKIKINGSKSKRSGTKAGMTCKITYDSLGNFAKKIKCKN